MSIAQYFSNKFQMFPKQSAESFIESLKDNLTHTPDLPRLSRRAKHLVFLYDDFMRHHPNHKQIRDGATFQATAFTVPQFSLWRKRLGKASFPVAIAQGFSGTPLRSIKGELFSLTLEQLISLDKHRENMTQFNRIRISLSIPYREVRFLKNRIEIVEPGMEPKFTSYMLGDEQIMQVNAWIYVGAADYWLPQLDAGYLFTPVNRYFNLNHNREYYYNTIMEYNE